MGSSNEKRNKNKGKTESNKKSENSSSVPVSKGKMITDSRFASVHSDPRFQKVPKNKSKVSIDSRFNRMFSDKNFSNSSAHHDKRGKPKKGSENKLRQYYRIEEEENDSYGDSEEADEEIVKTDLLKPTETLSESEASEASESEDEDDVKIVDSEATTDTDESDDEVYMEEEAEVQEENIPVIEKETRRLAVVNMDWRHVQASDLYVMLSSCLPKSGQILSVAIYPSEYGLERMKEEEVHGPVGLFDSEDDQSDEDDDEIDDEKLRAYEKSRLRYYYAVVECDSVATADYIYKACDGVEFERSANVLDLRFIPDSMEFKHPPRDVATEAPTNYDGLDFETQALQQSKINLTWDEDEPQRAKTLKRKFNADQLAELELKEFLASDESESEGNENNHDSEDGLDGKHTKVNKYRALIQSGDGSDEEGEENDKDMEVTFNTGLEELSKHILEKKDKKSETVWDAYLRKRREKKKARKNKSKDSSEDEESETDEEGIEEVDDFFVDEPSVKRSKKDTRTRKEREDKHQQDIDKDAEASRAELELLLADDQDNDTAPKGYNLKFMKAKGKKGKKGKEAPDESKIPTADYDDPRFSSLFTSHLFALDPTDPQFKRSAAYVRQVSQKHQNGEQEHTKKPTQAHLSSDSTETKKDENEKSKVARKEKLELSSLVKSIKLKSKQVLLPSDELMSKKVKRIPSSVIAESKKEDLSTSVQVAKKKSRKTKVHK